jgi:hypothetical protein
MKKRLLLPRAVKIACLLLMMCGFSAISRAQQVTESFEGPDFPPPGWTKIQWISAYPTWSQNPDIASHGSKSAIIGNSGNFGPNGWLVTPAVALEANEALTITFDYAVTTVTGAGAVLKITTGANATIEGQGTIIETMNLAATVPYTTHSVSFTATAAGTYYFGFFLEGLNFESFNMSLDKIIIQDAPDCNTPAGLAASGVTSNSAVISWAQGTGASSWQVQATRGSLPVEANWVNAVDNEAALSNLLPGTAYTVYVRAVCTGGGHSDFSNLLTVTTSCPDAVMAPYTVAFTEEGMPGCWSQNGDTNWKFNTYAGYAAENAGDHTLLQGYTQYAWIDGSDNTDGMQAVLVSPTVDISGLTNPSLEFFVYSENDNNAAFNELLVEVFNGTGWQTAAALTTASDGWKFYSIDLAGLGATATAQMRFTVTGNGQNGLTYYNDILIDDVSFKEKTVCTPVNAFNLDYSTDSTAGISWNADANVTAWDIAYGSYNYVFNGTATATEITNPYVLTTLDAATMYDIYIRANCGETAGEWTGPYTITTDCVVYVPVYDEPFNAQVFPPFDFNAPGLPACWQKASGGTLTAGPAVYGSGDWTPNPNAEYGITTNSQSVSITLYGGNTNSWLVSPLFDLSEQEYEIKARIGIDSGSPTTVFMGSDDEVRLLYSVNDTDWQTLKIWSGADNLSSGYTTSVISLEGITGEHVRFAFWAGEGIIDDAMVYTVHADNMQIRPKSFCTEPLNLSAVGITDTTANLTWDNTGEASDWEIAIVPNFGTPVDWVEISDNPYLATGLEANTMYDYYIKAVCGGFNSDIITGPYTFKTRCAPITAPYTETFLYPQTTPDCWITNPDPYFYLLFMVYSWNFSVDASTEAASAGDHTPGGGTQYAWLNTAGYSNNERASLITPLVDISPLENPALQFYLFSKNTLDAARNNVAVEVYDGEEWSTLTTINNTTNSWAPYTIDLSAFANPGIVQVRFVIDVKANGGNPGYDQILIDDVSFMEMPACPAPYAFSFTGITETDATVQWETAGDAVSWQIEYGTEGFTPGEGTVLTATTTNAVLENLEEGTVYDVYILALCGEGSELVGPQSFTTEAAAGTGGFILSHIKVFPNPVVTELRLESGSIIDTVELYNVVGQIVKKQALHSNSGTVDFSNLSSGIYVMKVYSGTQAGTYKIIRK